MARPPERITIKRRRDEEPVETLCTYPLIPPSLDRGLIACILDIEQKRIRSGFSWSRIDSHRPLVEGDASLPTPSSVSRQSNGIPIVRSAFLTDDRTINSFSNFLSVSSHLKEAQNVSGGHRKEATYASGVASEPSTPPMAPQPNQKKSSPSKPEPQPRKFHLSRRTFSLIPADSDSKGRIHKRKQHGNNLPVFVEKSGLVRLTQDNLPKILEASRDTAHTKGNGHQNAETTDGPKTPSGAQESEVKGCGAVVTPSTPGMAKKLNENLSEYSQNSIMLAWQLQELATKESLRSPPDLKGALPQSQPKIKLKPPRPRPQEKKRKSIDSGGDQVMDDAINLESEEDFVYDTYVRSSKQVFSTPKDMIEPMVSDPENIDSNRIGILVIEDDDQEIWETFAEEEESDKEWNSEEEDENGVFGHAVQFSESC